MVKQGLAAVRWAGSRGGAGRCGCRGGRVGCSRGSGVSIG